MEPTPTVLTTDGHQEPTMPLDLAIEHIHHTGGGASARSSRVTSLDGPSTGGTHWRPADTRRPMRRRYGRREVSARGRRAAARRRTPAPHTGGGEGMADAR